VDDQDDHGDDQKDVNQPAADIAEQTEKPENRDNDGYPKQHKSLLKFPLGIRVVRITICQDRVAANGKWQLDMASPGPG
jgi:hypothetical protein